MQKSYSFLTEGWFTKSDKEVARENISKRTAREYCEDLKTFIDCYREIFFVIVLLESEKFSDILFDHLVKHHSKVKDINKARYDDFDQAGKIIFGIILGVYDAMENKVLDRILDALDKHMQRFEPYEFKRYYLNTGLDTMYRDLYQYLKQNKLDKLIKEIENYINRTPLLISLQECLDDGIMAAKNDGYDIRNTTIPKNVIKSTNQKFDCRSSFKLPKMLVNTTPKNKVRSLKK